MRKEQEFIGIKTYKENRKQEILNSYDKYQIKKLEYLNNFFTNKSTKLSYFNGYLNNIHYAEVAKGKDLMFFTTEEIAVLIGSCIWSVDSTKNNLKVFIAGYCSWAKNVLGEITINPCDFLPKDITKNSQMLLRKKLISLDDFYAKCAEMEQESVKPRNIIVLVLARYGISGKELIRMRNLRWRDIDRENMVVNIYDDDGITLLSKVPIDNRFLFWLDKVERSENDEYIISSYGSGKPIAFATVYSRMNNCYSKINMKRIGYKDLLFNREIELLIELRKQKQLAKEDFEKMIEMFIYDKLDYYMRIGMLIDRYETLTGDKVLIPTKTGNKIANPNDISKEPNEKVVARIIKDLGMYIR